MFIVRQDTNTVCFFKSSKESPWYSKRADKPFCVINKHNLLITNRQENYNAGDIKIPFIGTNTGRKKRIVRKSHVPSDAGNPELQSVGHRPQIRAWHAVMRGEVHQNFAL